MKGSFPVELSFAPSPNTSLVLRTGTVSPDNVTVKAPKSIINEIASIKTAEVVPDGKSTEQSVNLVAYAKNGKILEGIEFEPAQVKVSYSLYDTKTLPIVLKTASGDLQLLPSKYTVEVYGHGSEFDYLKQIETEQINLQQFEVGSTITVKLNLPTDVFLTSGTDEIEIVLKEKYY